MTRKNYLMAAPLVLAIAGCGSNETILPTTPLTAEQIKAVQMEDSKIADEESQGSINKVKKKMKK
jgi:aconitase A